MSVRTFPALGFDPAPGSTLSAQGVADQVRGAATSIREAADVLGGTGQQDWQGEAATAFHGAMSQELTPRVGTAADSFESAAAALDTWATSLLGFQRQAEDLEARAATALANVGSASQDLSTAQQSDDPAADTDGPATQLAAATADLDSIRSQAYTLADVYAAEADHVASCLGAAADDAPDSGWWDGFTGWLVDAGNWVQDYVLPVLEDLITVLTIVVAVVAVVALLANPMGWAALAALAPLIGQIAFGLAVAGVAVNGLQWVGGREDGTDFAVGLLGLLAGAATGQIISGIKGIATAGGGWGGLVPAMAGTSGSAGSGALVATLGMHWNGAGAVASSVYVGHKLYSQSKSTLDTAESLNDLGSPLRRMAERFGSLFSGDGFTTAEQRRDIGSRNPAEC